MLTDGTQRGVNECRVSRDEVKKFRERPLRFPDQFDLQTNDPLAEYRK